MLFLFKRARSCDLMFPADQEGVHVLLANRTLLQTLSYLYTGFICPLFLVTFFSY